MKGQNRVCADKRRQKKSLPRHVVMLMALAAHQNHRHTQHAVLFFSEILGAGNVASLFLFCLLLFTAKFIVTLPIYIQNTCACAQLSISLESYPFLFSNNYYMPKIFTLNFLSEGCNFFFVPCFGSLLNI